MRRSTVLTSRIDLRNHRKILLVDGTLAFVGGLNIRDHNLLALGGRHATRDVHFAVRGPVLAQIDRTFRDDWRFAAKERLTAAPVPAPVPAEEGCVDARVLLDGPDEDYAKLQMTMVAVINAARQRIEICRCLLQEPELLIMDEPTSVLTPQEVAELFETLRRLAREGTAILYISHKLDEIRRLCDEATILREGRRVASADPGRESAASLAALMMGEGAVSEAPAATLATLGVGTDGEARADAPTAHAIRSPLTEPSARLVLDGVTLASKGAHGITLHGIDLSVAEGEIVGIAGVAGNGQDELMAAIGGETRLESASGIRLDDQDIGRADAGERRRLGLCAVPEERLGHAAVPTMTLAENAFLTGHHRRPLRRFGLRSGRASRAFADAIIARFDVRCNGASSLAGSLSGGNLQKFVVGREILQEPAVLVVSQPTWGVDAGAAAVIHAALRELAASGSAVLVVSQDLDELMALTDRLGALCAGHLSALYPTASLGVREVGLLMGGETLAA